MQCELSVANPQARCAADGSVRGLRLDQQWVTQTLNAIGPSREDTHRHWLVKRALLV